MTENDAKTIEFLIRNFSREYNINQMAKELNISPGGMFKILKKLEKQKFLSGKKLGNSIFYNINYNSQDATDACIFALTEKKTTPYVRAWVKDLEKMRPKTQTAILFGSILKRNSKARDIDVLLVFDKKNLKSVENMIDSINRIKSKRIHAVYQTQEDLIKNIKIRDEAILEEIRTGIILWGRDFLVEAIRHGQS